VTQVPSECPSQWIGLLGKIGKPKTIDFFPMMLMEHLQETIDFPMFFVYLFFGCPVSGFP
jgi:hypothetical protein